MSPPIGSGDILFSPSCFKASQKMGPQPIVSSDRLGEPSLNLASPSLLDETL